MRNVSGEYQDFIGNTVDGEVDRGSPIRFPN